jgi:hypothetical protein
MRRRLITRGARNFLHVIDASFAPVLSFAASGEPTLLFETIFYAVE